MMLFNQENVVKGGNFTFSDLNSRNATVENIDDSMLEEMVEQVFCIYQCLLYSIFHYIFEFNFLLFNVQVPPPRRRSVHPRPLPDSCFIAAEQRQSVPLGGSVAGVAEAMKREKLRSYEEKKEAALAEKLKKTEEAKQLKYEMGQLRKLQAQQRKQEAAEMKKLAATEKRNAQLTAKAKKAEEKKKLAAARQQIAAEKRAAKAATSQPKHVSMSDELRD
jgi:hypothetical protein